MLVQAARQQWNIRIAERYPHGRGVMKYLARYVRGGPIKDHRLLSFDGQQVTFRYGNHRELDEQGQPRQQELTLTVAEFLRRWSEHVPLPGVHTVRAWGLYASTQRPKLARCREELPEKETTWEKPKAAQERSLHNHPWEQCPVCQQPMIPVKCYPEQARRRSQSHWRWRPEGEDQIPIGRRSLAACPTTVGADTEQARPGTRERVPSCPLPLNRYTSGNISTVGN